MTSCSSAYALAQARRRRPGRAGREAWGINRHGGDGPLGELRFVEGERPGSNLTYVEAPDLATLACLQTRLNELGEDLAIEIREW